MLRTIAVVVALALLLPGGAGAAGAPTPEQARALIQENLVYHAPSFGLSLDQVTDAERGGNDLVTAGILTADRMMGRICREPMARYRLSEQGLRTAGQRGWTTQLGALGIPVGRFIYVPGKYALKRNAAGTYQITFRFRYAGNANAHFLLSVGKAEDWATGDGLSLANLGEVLTKTVTIVQARGKWRIAPWPAAPVNNRCGVM